MAYNYNSDIWSRIRPKIQQWESVTGRTVPPSMLRSFMEAELNTEAGRADKARALDIQESSRKDWADVANKRTELEAKANTVSGIGQLITGGIGAYGLGKEAGLWGGSKAVGLSPSATTAYNAFKAMPSTITGSGATTMGASAPATGLATGAQLQLPGATAPSLTGVPTLTALPEATATGAELASTTPAVAGSIGGSIAPIGLASGALGVGAGMLGKAITGYGKEGHMGGERYTSAGIGAVGGAAAGFAVGGPIGAIIGGITGLVGGGCIIVTACNGKDSEEVKIARQYRNQFMTPEQIRGYYIIAESIVPKMGDEGYKAYIKENLVDRLIEYGKYALGITEEKPSDVAIVTTTDFMKSCELLGNTVKKFTRNTVEVV
jgi:hypothetical protein